LPSSREAEWVSLAEIPSWQELSACWHSIENEVCLNETDDALFAAWRGVHPAPQSDCSLNRRVSVHHGDITLLKVVAVVNAARPSLLGGGGVDRAIHLAAGPELVAECRTLQGCRHGNCKATSGYMLPAQHIIHTAGPQSDLHDVSEGLPLLVRAYMSCLWEAETLGVRSIAFCCISAGAYRSPTQICARAALCAVREWLSTSAQIERVIFCTFTECDRNSYARLMPVYFPFDEPQRGGI
jgi:O-acetyl-ADP-ribose deacetylase (regulator of RNase III)